MSLRSFYTVCLLVLFPLFTQALEPTKDSGKIASLVGDLLAREHYLQHPLDDEMSSRFLELYLDALDYNHLIFLQSDVQGFQKYTKTLDDMTLDGNVRPGFEIYNLFVKRFQERIKLAKELLKEKYTFDGNDSILIDRHEAPWPANDEEARQLWRQRVKSDLLQERLNKKKHEEAVELLSKRYDRILKEAEDQDLDSVMQRYLTSLANAYDPHSDYWSRSESESFAISMQLSLVGIGAMLTTEDGYAKIMAVVPGGPADLDKRLKVNDRIAAVGEGNGPMVDVVDMNLKKTVELIRGKKDTEVRLLVIPAQSPDQANRVEIRLKRDEIKLKDSEAQAKMYNLKGSKDEKIKLGYIEIPSFYASLQNGGNIRSVTTDVAMLIDKLKSLGAQGIILDLRKNGGGSLGEVVSLTGLFIETGPVVQVKDSRGSIKVLKDEDPSILYEGPLLVMVHHTSASASEIFAAAMQDYRRGVVVGEESTFGKGTVQKVEPLESFLKFLADKPSQAGDLKVTTQKFYRISGGSTQYRGVIPDVRFPSVADYMKGLNEQSLKYPLPYDEVPPARFSPVNSVLTLLPELSKKSYDRISRDPEFGFVREDIERYKAHLDDKTISLNEEKRLAEKKELRERLEKRKADRLARRMPEHEKMEITLESITGENTPGLTREVIEDARKRELASNGDLSDDLLLLNDDLSVDPELEESIHILTDLMDMTTKSSKSEP